jgi:DNA adenine methylase
MGGKSRLRKEIIARLPHHTRYVEVFGGAGWVLFGKEPSICEVYNDIDSELTNFFRVVKSCHKAFVQAFDWILFSRRLFYDYLATKEEDLDEIQRAVRFYYIIKCSFGGKWSSPTFGYSKTGPARLNLEELYNTFTAVHKRLQRVYIEEGPYQDVIRRYDGKDTVFFLDPPYYKTAHYRYIMHPDDYTVLKKTLAGIKGKFLLTINDHETMRNLFRNFRIDEVKVPYSIGRKITSRGRFGELIITNY